MKAIVKIEMFLMLVSVILGIGAAEVSSWIWAIILIFAPFGWAYTTNFSKRLSKVIDINEEA